VVQHHQGPLDHTRAQTPCRWQSSDKLTWSTAATQNIRVSHLRLLLLLTLPQHKDLAAVQLCSVSKAVQEAGQAERPLSSAVLEEGCMLLLLV